MNYRLINADVMDGLRDLADESVQCVVTSPPYWGLRDYGVAGQLGLERTPNEYVSRMVAVFAEVRRVLRSDGTLWLNVGDSYASARDSKVVPDSLRTGTGTAVVAGAFNRNPAALREANLKHKDLCGVPWRLAFGLQSDGWYLRCDIIWSKPNPMPESVTDRPTKAHEYLFLLSKSRTYSYDADAIKEPGIEPLAEPDANGSTISGGAYGRHVAGDAIPKKERRSDKQRGHSRKHAGFNDRWDAMERKQQCAVMRNKRSVWEIAPAQYREAHFATFPPALVEPCILAGSKVGDTILDPFNGSGTTGVVALSHQRNYIGIELNPDYCAMARRRLDNVAPLFTHASNE